jgi:hypothetical protein
MIAWALPFFLLFVVVGPLLIAGRMFGWRCISGLKAWIRVDFLQGSYKKKQEGGASQTLKESCQTNFEIILLVRRICLTVVSLFSASLCDDTGGALCTPKVVAVNAVLFASVIIQMVLMPFRNRVHNHLEMGSLILNFLLFDIALLATSGQGSNVDNVATVSLVLDLVRVVAFLALGGYSVYMRTGQIYLGSLVNRDCHMWTRLKRVHLLATLPSFLLRPAAKKLPTLLLLHQHPLLMPGASWTGLKKCLRIRSQTDLGETVEPTCYGC